MVMKKVLIIMLMMAFVMPNDAFAQNRKEKKASAKATTQSRGVKVNREECEELAMDITAAYPRAAGNAVSANEAMATNLAMLDARANLAQQLEVMVNGLLSNFGEQYTSGKASNIKGSSKQLQEGYFSNILNNTRPIKKNTYLKQDGNYNVYVCIEMNPELNTEIYNKLRQDEILHIDFDEAMFIERMNKAREEYIRMRENE